MPRQRGKGKVRLPDGGQQVPIGYQRLSAGCRRRIRKKQELRATAVPASLVSAGVLADIPGGRDEIPAGAFRETVQSTVPTT